MTYRLAFAAAFVLSIVGCGGPKDQPETGEVRGKVTLDGAPLPGATVTFQPADGRPSTGVTNPDGSYQLQYNAETMGAKVGEHNVVITTLVEPQIDDDTGKVEKPGFPERVPKRYIGSGEMKKTVESGDNEISFDLKSK